MHKLQVERCFKFCECSLDADTNAMEKHCGSGLGADTKSADEDQMWMIKLLSAQGFKCHLTSCHMVT